MGMTIAQFVISIVCIVVILLLYYGVPDKDFGISVFFFTLLCFANLINETKLVIDGKVMLVANLVPLYVWSLWFIFIHDRYNNSEEGSMVQWMKSLLMVLLLPISHAKAVKSSYPLNITMFVITSLLFVIPVYMPKITMEQSIREIVIGVMILLVKTVIYLMVYIAADMHNNGRTLTNLNNSLWVLGSSIWLLPIAFLQIGVYLFIQSNSTKTSHRPLLPVKSNHSRRARHQEQETSSMNHHDQEDPGAIRRHLDQLRLTLSAQKSQSKQQQQQDEFDNP